MNTFQQQYLSVLGAATGKKFLEAATGNKELISKDKTMMNDMAGEVNESIQSKKHAKHFAGMIARAQDADPLSMDAETLTEVNSTLYAQQRKINELQRGWDADKAKELGMVSKLMSQGNAKREKGLKQWYKDLTGGKK